MSVVDGDGRLIGVLSRSDLVQLFLRRDRAIQEEILEDVIVRTLGLAPSSLTVEVTACITVAHGTPCLGPVTHSGCGAICPAYGRGCYGCFGPSNSPNLRSMVRQLRHDGMSERDILRVFRTINFNAASPEYAPVPDLAAEAAEEQNDSQTRTDTTPEGPV